MRDDVADHIPCERHIVVEVGKGDLRLDHPEFRSVARGVGILRAEGGTEGVDVAERHSVGLTLELSRDGEVRALAEEVLRKIDVSVLGAGQVLEIQRGDAEHLASALTVGARDQGRVHIDEAAGMEEIVNGEGDLAAHAEDGGEKIRPRAKICLLPQEFHGMPFRLEGIIGGRGALYGDLRRFQLEGLLCPRGQGQDARHDKRRADVLCGDLVVIL